MEVDWLFYGSFLYSCLKLVSAFEKRSAIRGVGLLLDDLLFLPEPLESLELLPDDGDLPLPKLKSSR